MNIAECNKQ